MRHFLGPPPTPGPLARGMPPGAAPGPLVASPGPSQGLPAPGPGAIRRAIDVSVVTSPADRCLLPATLALEEPKAVLDHRDPGRRGNWTTGADRGIKEGVALLVNAAIQKARGVCD